MADNSNGQCDTDRLVSSPVLVGNICAEERDSVDPEGVEGVNSVSGLGALSKGTRLALV
jgi:hypothetical protein